VGRWSLHATVRAATSRLRAYRPGVWIADNFRSNLIIDRYDPVFADMRGSKLRHLRSVNSEDAVTWNVFRSLRQIAPKVWLPPLWSRSFDVAVPDDLNAAVTLWKSVPPPLGLFVDGDEGSSEIDVVIEAASWVWFIEAKYRGDISKGTTTRPTRDQVLRNIDVGSSQGTQKATFIAGIASSSITGGDANRVESATTPRLPISTLWLHTTQAFETSISRSLLRPTSNHRLVSRCSRRIPISMLYVSV